MRKLILFSIRHPWPVVLFVAALTAVAVFGITRIEIEASLSGMRIQGTEAQEYYEETLDVFGTDNINIVYVRAPDLFTPQKFQRLDALVRELDKIEGVDKVESLFSVTNFKNVDGFLETSPLIDWLPETQEEVEQIRRDALNNPVLVDDLISEDGKVTAINIYVDQDKNDEQFNIKFTKKVESILEKYDEDFEQLFQLGLLYTSYEISNNILSDQMTLLPLSAGVLLLALVVLMRTISGAKLPILTAGTSIIWTAGFMGLAGIPLNMLTAIVPSLIIVIGSTEDMHILSEYMEGMEHENGRKKPAIDFMAKKVGMSVMLTAFTTFVGFLSISLNQITILKQFGLASAFGLFVNPLLTCTLGPIFLLWFGPSLRSVRKATFHSWIDRRINGLGDLIIRVISGRKKVILSFLLLGAAVLGLGIFDVRVDNELLRYFKPDSEIRTRSRIMSEDLSGSQNFFLRISTGEEMAFKKAENLRKVQKIQYYMDAMGVFDKTTSLADKISLIHRVMNNDDEQFYEVPQKDDLISQYLLFLHRKDLESFVSSDYSEVNIIVRHNITSSHRLEQALEQLENHLDFKLGRYMHYGITGENVLIAQAADSMVQSQVQSLSLLLVIIFVIMTVLFANLKAGFLSLIPNVFPIVLNFGIMGFLGIPLNTGTTMVAAIAIGIAVDDTIHFMSRYNKEMRELQNQEAAMRECIRAEIKPVFTTSVALALGFSVLAFSNFMPIIHFGLLSAMVMFFALIGDMFVTPILLSSTQLITLWDLLTLSVRREVIEGSPLFRHMHKIWIKKVILLGRLREKKAGETVMREGDHGESMCLLLSGTAEVFLADRQGHKIDLATLKPGDVFGEIALIDPGPRSANVKALEDLSYIELDMKGLRRIQRIYPRISSRLFMNVSDILGKRLSATNYMLSEWRLRT